MNKNVENQTPPESPIQADSPGPAAAIAGLSIDNSDSRKRSASSDLQRPPKQSSPRQNAKSSRQRGQPFARAQGQYPRQNASRVRSKVQYGNVARASDIHRGESKHQYPLPRDSGYDTMPSRQNTLQQDSPKATVKARAAPLQHLPKVKEVHSPPVTQVPVLKDPRYPHLIMQPESSPISQDQLAAEVKGIYGGLVMVEAKCINIDAAQAADPTSSLGPEQWQALIALHRTLLYEHHDFLMATQHPSATPALRGLAQKYSMPARMWRHGIHAFLEVLRHRRPESHDYMVAFVYLAYQMMALLFETVPIFTDTWIECLGDLARYRMAIEDEKESHSVWGGVAASWYNTASDRHPSIGRLYHHLGILERPSLRKLFFYGKSLTCVIPFPNARDSMATLCSPVVQEHEVIQRKGQTMEAAFMTLHAQYFMELEFDVIKVTASDFISRFRHSSATELRDFSVPVIVTNIAALLEYGSPSNTLWQLFGNAINHDIQSQRPSTAAESHVANHTQQDILSSLPGTSAPELIYDFCDTTFKCLISFASDSRTASDLLRAIHAILVWLHSLHSLRSKINNEQHTHTLSLLMSPTRFPWVGLCNVLNVLCQSDLIQPQTMEYARQGIFPAPQDNSTSLLQEDPLLRGLIWTQWYYPQSFLSGQGHQAWNEAPESPAARDLRVIRIQYLALSLALRNSENLKFDEDTTAFWTPAMPEPMEISAQDGLPFDEPAHESTFVSTSKGSSSPKTGSSHSDSDGYTLVEMPKRKSRAGAAPKSKKTPRDWANIKVVDDEGMQWET